MSYYIFDSYCLRTPLFSFSDYKENIEKGDFLDTDFEKILKNGTFREALFLASPELFAQIKKLEGGFVSRKKKKEKLELAILKYYTRISTRCTPFGLFASCSHGNFGSDTLVQLKSLDKYKRITRFDTTFLMELFSVLLKNEEIRSQLLFYKNTSLYRIGDEYRYVEYRIENNKRRYSIEGVKCTLYLEKILKNARNGKTIKELVNIIVDEDVEFSEAKEFIDELIANQILVSDLEVTVTGNDYFSTLVDKVIKKSKDEGLKKKFQDLELHLKKIDRSFENLVDTYSKLKDKTMAFVAKVEDRHLFQTDTFSSTIENKLNRKLKKEIYKALKILNKLTLTSKNDRIEEFKKKFEKRYENEKLPLAMVLDVETGIGYGEKKENNTPLLDEINIQPPEKRFQQILWRDIDIVIQKKLVKALVERDTKIKLTEKDFEHIEDKWDDLPNTFSSIIEVYNESGKEKIYIKEAGGSSGVNLLGRFGNGDNAILEHIENIIEKELSYVRGKILAEIVHLPQARAGNILHRPDIREYEIPYIGKSNKSKNKQIDLRDILVSVENDEIKLFSRKFGKEIIPCLSNAHNFKKGALPVYSFLCDLQTQKKRTGIGFLWNTIFLENDFLPRVEFNNVIFSKARWNIDTRRLEKIVKDKNFSKSVEEFRKEVQLPNYVELVEGDNRLLVYLENKKSVQMLYDSVRRKKFFILEEFLFTENEFVKRGGKSFCNQFVISYYKNN